MIYRLNDEFTKIEETEGMLENKSVHTPIEIVMVNGVPEKDAGFELQPKEKMPFKVKDGESVYARCTNLDHMGANLTVANFNMPASDGTGAGAEFDNTVETLFQGSVANGQTYVLAKDVSQYKLLLINGSRASATYSATLPYLFQCDDWLQEAKQIAKNKWTPQNNHHITMRLNSQYNGSYIDIAQTVDPNRFYCEKISDELNGVKLIKITGIGRKKQ